MLKKLSYNLRKPGLTELLALLVFIVFIPSFFVSDEIMNGTRMAKEFGLSITLAIVLPIALILWTIYNWKDLSIGITKIDILVAIFAAYCGFLVWYHGYTDRIEIKFFMYGSAYILFRMFFSSFKKNTQPEYSWKNPRVYFPVLLSLILSAHCIIGLLQLYGVMNSYHAYFKVTGMFFNPAPYAGVLIALSPLCIATYMEMKKHKEKWGKGLKVAANLLLASFILMMSLLPVTQSRAAWVAFAGAMAFLVWRYYPVKEWWATYFPKTWMKVTTITLATVLIVSSAIGLYYYKKDSTDGRLLIWKVSGDVIKENPILGTGLGKFAVNYGKAQAKYFKNGMGSESEKWVAGNVSYPFNEFLRIQVEGGIIGMGILLIILTYLIFSIYKQKAQNTGYILGAAAIFLFGLFSYPASIPYHLLLLVLFIVGFSHPILKTYRKIQIVIVPVLLVSLSISFIMINNLDRKVEAYKEWKKAYQTYNFGNYELSSKLYKSIFPELAYNGQFLLNYGKSLNVTGNYLASYDILKYTEGLAFNDVLLNTQAENLKNLGRYVEAEQYFLTSCNLKPSNLFPKYLLVRLFILRGEVSRAKYLARDIKNFNSKKLSTAEIKIKNEMDFILDSDSVSIY